MNLRRMLSSPSFYFQRLAQCLADSRCSVTVRLNPMGGPQSLPAVSALLCKEACALPALRVIMEQVGPDVEVPGTHECSLQLFEPQSPLPACPVAFESSSAQANYLEGLAPGLASTVAGAPVWRRHAGLGMPGEHKCPEDLSYFSRCAVHSGT